MRRYRLLTAIIVIGVNSTAACAHAQAAGQSSAAGALNQQAMSSDGLDKLLAPIALYPDALVVQVLQCSTSPYQVRQVNDWLQKNPDLKGTAAQDAATKQGFDASFVAIVLFPQVLEMMASKPDWTQQLGQAFTTDRDGVFTAVQRLREQAKAAGNLKTTQQQDVQTVTTDTGQQVIVIQPANPQVVYVPQYNPQVVYTQPAPTSSSSSDGTAAAAGLIGFAAGVIVGAAADDGHDHYYYSYGGWGYRGGICYSGGYNDYYQHRENMANDYYDYRENMADQRGENQAQRQDAWSQNQSQRQDTRSQNQSTREDTRNQNQSTRQENQSTRQSTRSENQSTRQSNVNQQRDTWQGDRSSAMSSRGSYQGGSQFSSRTQGTSSGAFSGYQRGSTERASSERGRSSMSSRSFGGRGGRRR